MFLEHRGKRPTVHPTAYVAPTATICGDVTIGENTRVLFGAVISADGGPVTIGSECIVMENAVIRGTPKHPAVLNNQILVGPRAYLTGCTIEDEVFLATGSTVFNGAIIRSRAEVRINGVVHLKTVIPEGATVPIAWVAVGDPTKILPPDQHDEIWSVQKELNFPREVFGLERPPEGQSKMPELTQKYSRALAQHLDDVVLDDSEVRRR